MALLKSGKSESIIVARLPGVLHHVRLDEALSIITRRALETAERDGAAAKITGDISNVLIEMLAIYFHGEKELADKGRGATLGTLQLAAFLHNLSSPRRVNSTVDYLVQQGRLNRIADPKDRRVGRLVPKKAAIDTNRAHVLTVSDALPVVDILTPISQRLRSGDDRPFFEMMLQLGRLYTTGADPLKDTPDLAALMTRDAGNPIMHSLVGFCYAEHGKLVANKDFPAMSADMSTRFGISRGHVRNLILIAEKRRLLSTTNGRTSVLKFTNKMLTDWRILMARTMIINAEAGRRAFGEEPCLE